MPVPKKYTISCRDSEDGHTILVKEFEALNRQEAEARGYLNCLKGGGEKGRIEIEVR